MRQFIRTIYVFLFAISSQGVSGANIVVGDPSAGLLPHVGTKAGDTIATLISYAIGLAGVLAVIAVIWSAIQMILASGDEEQVKKARKGIIYAFIGVVVAGLAYGMVKVFTSLNLDTFV